MHPCSGIAVRYNRRATPMSNDPSPTPAGVPVIVDPSAVYTLASAREALGLPANTLKREVRLGRLRVSKRSVRYFILGAWLREWLERGEVGARKRKARAGARAAD